jgi:hypothetical protein
MEIAVALKLLVSRMSAPAARYLAWISLDDLRLGQAQQVVVALEVVGEIGEALAAIIGFGQLVRLDHRPHRPVEDQDALGEQGMQQVGAGHGGGRIGKRAL